MGGKNGSVMEEDWWFYVDYLVLNVFGSEEVTRGLLGAYLIQVGGKG